MSQLIGLTAAQSTAWRSCFNGSYSAPMPDGSVYFARAAKNESDELVTRATGLTLDQATSVCHDLLRRGFAVAAVFAEFDDRLWEDHCRMVAGPFTACGHLPRWQDAVRHRAGRLTRRHPSAHPAISRR